MARDPRGTVTMTPGTAPNYREWQGFIPVGGIIWGYYVRDDGILYWWPVQSRPYTDGETTEPK